MSGRPTHLCFWLVLLIPLAGLSQPRPPQMKADSVVQKVIHNGKTLPAEVQDCLGREIRRRTVLLTNPRVTCTGVILDSNTIVSAGHCHPKPSKQRKVNLGIEGFTVSYFDEAKGKLVANDSSVASSSQFEGDPTTEKSKVWAKDALALKLERPIPGNFPPLKRAKKNSLKANDFVVVAGYGTTETGEMAKSLKYFIGRPSEVPPLPGQKESELAVTPLDSEDRVGEGDSGGPAFRVKKDSCEIELIGITIDQNEFIDGTQATHLRSIEELDEHIEGANNGYDGIRDLLAPPVRKVKGAK